MADEARVWAPWRIHYILSPKEGGRASGCPFCTAPTMGPGPDSLVLASQPDAFVMLNRYPYTGCHLMVIPTRHESDLSALAPAEYTAVMTLVRESTARLQQACNPHGINLGMNLGEAAGAGIAQHLHVHLVPRWRGDTNFMSVTAGSRVVSQGLDHAYEMLRPFFADLDTAA
jgi:ATP adenylyltransferase